MLPLKTQTNLIATLQRHRQEADANRYFGKTKHPRKGYFAAYPPEVQKVCWEHFSALCAKNKARLESNRSLIGMLVATATRLALDQLGITQISRKAWLRHRSTNHIKVVLGIRDPDPNPFMNNRRKRAKVLANMQERDVPIAP